MQPALGVLGDTKSDWYLAKIEVGRLMGDFQTVMEKAIENNPLNMKVNKKGKDSGATVRLANIKGNPCYLQVIQINKSIEKARYVMYEQGGSRAFIRELVERI